MLDLIPGTSIGEYTIEKSLAEGSVSDVYLVIHPKIGKRAAIKVLRAKEVAARDRFVDEARSCNQIGHRNVVDVFSFGELADGRPYIVMEYLQGESLAERMRRGPVPLAEAIPILDQIAAALQATHAKQIVHGELTSKNVYLTSAGVKLLAFAGSCDANSAIDVHALGAIASELIPVVDAIARMRATDLAAGTMLADFRATLASLRATAEG